MLIIRRYSSSGEIYLAKRYATGDKVAIRETDLSRTPWKDYILSEVLVLKESQHPNIIQFLDLYLVNNMELWVVMEYVGGSILTHIIENNALVEEQMAKICLEVRCLISIALAQRQVPCSNFVQTCKGLAYLHNRYFIHRDIKSDSIVLSPQGCIKIGMLSCFHALFFFILSPSCVPQPIFASAPN
jgi:serine/threonine-protein kinase CLA4